MQDLDYFLKRLDKRQHYGSFPTTPTSITMKDELKSEEKSKRPGEMFVRLGPSPGLGLGRFSNTQSEVLNRGASSGAINRSGGSNSMLRQFKKKVPVRKHHHKQQLSQTSPNISLILRSLKQETPSLFDSEVYFRRDPVSERAAPSIQQIYKPLISTDKMQKKNIRKSTGNAAIIASKLPNLKKKQPSYISESRPIEGIPVQTVNRSQSSETKSQKRYKGGSPSLKGIYIYIYIYIVVRKEKGKEGLPGMMIGSPVMGASAVQGGGLRYVKTPLRNNYVNTNTDPANYNPDTNKTY